MSIKLSGSSRASVGSKSVPRLYWRAAASRANVPASRCRPRPPPAPTDQACRRARANQGQALRLAAKMRPALTGPARDGCEIGGRDGRMLAARVEPKNGPEERRGCQIDKTLA